MALSPWVPLRHSTSAVARKRKETDVTYRRTTTMSLRLTEEHTESAETRAQKEST